MGWELGVGFVAIAEPKGRAGEVLNLFRNEGRGLRFPFRL